jgi:ribosomal protein S12 methylthiotransferase accessory factor
VHIEASQLAQFNITRTGDLTELDIIGIPVWFSVRPNSRNLSVSQGKGLTHAQARISAIMESIEGAVGEQTREIIGEFGTFSALQARNRTLVDLKRINRCLYSQFDKERERAWVEGFSSTSGKAVHCPYELIGLDMRGGFPWDRKAFKMGSGGLAAGFSFEFAALRAVLELIERDAIVLVEAMGLHRMYARPIAWRPGVHEGLDDAVRRVLAAGLEPRFFEVPSRFGLPVVAAAITRPVLQAEGAGYRLSGGYGCHFSAGDAALAAILEAVQSRLTNIAGSRDDMSEAQYELGGHHLPRVTPETVPFDQIGTPLPQLAGLDDGEKLRWLVQRMMGGGCGDVYLFDLPGPVKGIHVARALVPGLRAYFEGESTQVSVTDMLGLSQ